MVRVMPFKRSQQLIQSDICWFLAHSCLTNGLAPLEIAFGVARVCRASAEMFVQKNDCESDYNLCSHASNITVIILMFP
jgi:hypothetical protein